MCSSPLGLAQQPEPIEPTDLSEPPDGIQALIESARVTFEAGERNASTHPPAQARITAETNYSIAYNYSSQSRWQVENGNRTVVINVRYIRIGWKPMHTIWFRKRPASKDFWSNKLVLHELDHVRISSDPRLARRFEQMLKENPVLNQTISEDDVVNRQFVDRLVDQHVAKVFADISDLISIRYRELDRVTNHGLRPVPSDSILMELLRPGEQLSGER